MVSPMVHIFACGPSLGFSLTETGEDLPTNGGQRWVWLNSAELSADLLRVLPVDAMGLLDGIITAGHHVTLQLAQPLLPIPHRQSA